MGRNHYSPSRQLSDTPTQPIELGGTGASTAEQAVENLGGVFKGLYNQPNGVAGMTSKNVLKQSVIPQIGGSKPTLNGDLIVYANSITDYEITNYDSLTDYTVSVSAGEITRKGAILTYKAPQLTGSFDLTVNNKSMVIQVQPLPAVNLTGPTSALKNGICVLTITDYDSEVPYYATCTAGSVSVVDDKVIFVTPSTTGSFTITVNGLTPWAVTVLATPELYGETETLYVGAEYELIISDYNSATTYTVSAVSGTVSVSNGIITYTAPSQPGYSGFTINGVLFTLYVNDYPVPSIAGETEVFTDTSISLTIANYVETTTYTLSTSNGGIAARSGNVITYTAPVTPGTDTLTVSVGGTKETVYGLKIKTLPVISGPSTIYTSEAATYLISNYNADAEYVLSTLVGSATRTGNIIIYTAPSMVQSAGFTVNGITIPVALISDPVVTGDSTCYPNKVLSYIISNYDENATYTLSAVRGTAIRSGDVIVYTAPDTVGTGGFILNGRTTSVPTIAYPVPELTVASSTLRINKTTTIIIANYDADNEYVVTASIGLVSVSGNTITFTGSVVGSAVITVQGIGSSKTTTISVENLPVPILEVTNSTTYDGVYRYSTLKIEIINYDTSDLYEVSITGGTQNRTDDVIWWYGPSDTVGTFHLTVTGLGGVSNTISLSTLIIE